MLLDGFIIATPKNTTLYRGDALIKVIPTPTSIQNYSKSPWGPHRSLAAAIGAAWALDIPFNVIEAGAETFIPDAIHLLGA